MSTPKRIQRKRTRGYRLPPDCVYVGRPSKWGNPETGAGSAYPSETAVDAFSMWLMGDPDHVYLYGPPPTPAEARAALFGRNLACWCRLCDKHKDGLPLGEKCPDCDPCHADILLAIANTPEETTP